MKVKEIFLDSWTDKTRHLEDQTTGGLAVIRCQSSQCLKPHRPRCDPFQKRPRSVSPLCSVGGTWTAGLFFFLTNGPTSCPHQSVQEQLELAGCQTPTHTQTAERIRSIFKIKHPIVRKQPEGKHLNSVASLKAYSEPRKMTKSSQQVNNVWRAKHF